MIRNHQVNPEFGKAVPCICTRQSFEERRHAWLMKFCNFPKIAEQMTFDTLEAKPEVLDAIRAAFDLLAGKLTFLTLIGRVDTGKTHIAISLCKEFIACNIPAKFEYTPTLLSVLRQTFDKDASYSYARMFDLYSQVPLLVFDDFYRQKTTPWTEEVLSTLINIRHAAQRPTVVTTNKPLSVMADSIRSRLQREEWCKVVVIGQPPEENISQGINEEGEKNA
jgi:DNA replication protein DnaC